MALVELYTLIAKAATKDILSRGVKAETALSTKLLYSSSLHNLCKVDSGSFKVTGMEILLKIFPNIIVE